MRQSLQNAWRLSVGSLWLFCTFDGSSGRSLRKVFQAGKRALNAGALHVEFDIAVGDENLEMADWPPLQRRGSDPRIIVSLTTVPAGVETLGPTLRSLKNQSILPDAIELNLPRRSSRGLGIYEDLRQEDAEGIDVYRTKDWLTLTNIVPTIQRARSFSQSTLVIVVDDDKVYPPTLVEDHLRAHRANPQSASTCRGYRTPPGGDLSPGVFFPAWNEIWFSRYGHEHVVPEQVAIVTGSDSWSCPAELFGDGLWADLNEVSTVDDNDTIQEAASSMNDVWVSGHLSRQHVPKFVIPCHRECQSVPKSGKRERQGIEFNRRKARIDMNEQVMKFYLNDWLPEEIMPENEVRSMTLAYTTYTRPRPPPDIEHGGIISGFSLARHLLGRAFRNFFA